MLIYLKNAIPKEYVYLLSSITTMDKAWQRLEGRFGDVQQRIQAIHSKLASVELKGKEFERIE